MKGLRFLLGSALAAAALAAAATAAHAQTVVATQRLGVNLEELTFVESGPWAGHVAIVDGYNLIATKPNQKHADLMFSVEAFGPAGPRGVTFDPANDNFYFCLTTQPNQLFVTDSNGVQQPTVLIQFAPGQEGFSCEGLSYIPTTAAQYPGRLILSNSDNNGNPRIVFLREDGTVDLQISPAFSPLLPSGPVGVQWLEDGKLLVSGGNSLLTMDYSGAIDPQPFATILGAASVEGVTMLGNGKIAAIDYSTPHLYMFNSKGYRLGDNEADFSTGIGLSRPIGIAWDTVRDSFLMNTLQDHGDTKYRSTAVNRTLKGFAHITVPENAVTSDATVLRPFGGITSLTGENLLAVGTRGPNSIAVYDATTGAYLYKYNVPGLTTTGGITYDSINRMFIVRTQGTLRFVPRDGTPGSAPDIVNSTVASTLTLSPIPGGGGVSWHKSGSAPRIAAGDSIYDAATGVRIGTPITAASLGIPSIHAVVAITSGPYKGMFAAMNVDSSTIVIYSLP